MDFHANIEMLNIAFTSNRTSDTLATQQFTCFGAHVVWTSLTGTVDATVSVEGSNDNTNWDALTSPITLSGASGNDLILVSNVFCSYLRVVATKNNVTGGTIKVVGTLKEG